MALPRLARGLNSRHRIRASRATSRLSPAAVLAALACCAAACQRADTLDDLIQQLAAASSTATRETVQQAITLAANDERVAVRRGAVDAILHLEGKEFSREVHRALQDVHPAIRLQAARAMERWGTSADVEALDRAAGIEEAGDTPEAAAEMAAHAAVRARIGDHPEPAQRALEDLNNPVAHARMLAAVSLGYYRWPPSIPALQRAAVSETDPTSRAMAVCALAAFDHDAVTPILAQLESQLQTGDPLTRRCAVKALGASGETQRASQVAKGLSEDDPLTRRWAVVALRRLGALAAYRRQLIVAARSDADVAVRAEALAALAALGGPRVDATLTKALADPSPRVRGIAAYELARKPAAAGVGRTLADPAWEVRVATLIGLSRRTATADGVN